MENNTSNASALILISKLFNEGKLTEGDRETLKDMIFNDDQTLLGFFEHYEDPKDIENAVLKYAKGGAIEAMRPPGLTQLPKNADDLDQLTSPTDSALDMKKRKRLNQQLAAEREKQQHTGIGIGVTDCDLGASPQLSKGPMMKKAQGGKYSPLQKAKEFTLGK